MRVPERWGRAAWAGLLALLWLAAPSGAQAQAPVSIQATMILASDQPSAQDPRLDLVEYKLRRMFRFEYYRHYGEGSAVLNLPGSTVLDLGRGFRLNLSGASAGKGKVRAGVQWLRGGDVLLNTTVVMDSGAPVILGGVSHEGGTLIVVLSTSR